MDTKKIIQDQIDIYLDNFLINKDNSLGTFQNDRVTQYMRFKHIIDPFKEILNEEITFHDFGCGCCDMYQYIKLNNIPLKYSGTEIIQEMIDHARFKYPGIELYNRDVLKENIKDRYDIVVFSGGLYLPGSIPQNDWKDFVFSIINKMWEMSNIGISFNLLTTHSDYKKDHLFYFDPVEMFNYCINNFSRFVKLDHAYPLYEWSISAFKEDYMKVRYKDTELNKYLKK
jgi:hypothetical protein